MSSPVPALRSRFSKCVRNSCESQNCKLNLNAFPSEKIILDIDCIAKENPSHIQGERCDYIIVAKIVAKKNDLVFLLPVEFKTKRVIPDKVKNQLEGGIRFFEKHHQNQFMCCPILVSQGLRPSISKRLQKISIGCNGKNVRIKHVLCGGSLSWSNVARSKAKN